MSRETSESGPAARAGSDIDHLRRELEMPELPYVDFAARRERERLRQRWPLLRELELRRERKL